LGAWEGLSVPEASGSVRGGSILAALIIGSYLVVHTLLLSLGAALAWLAPGGAELVDVLRLNDHASAWAVSWLPPAKFAVFQRVTISACSAGLGGAVFMIREFYLKFAYGSQYKDEPRRFLESREIPRYLLLPFSSVVLGPIGLCLLQGGSLVFTGFKQGADVPIFSCVALSFLLGFTYHDTLAALRNLSRRALQGSAGSGAGE
jgi:hypothetical protein